MHSQEEIRLALVGLMAPGVWYSVDDLISIIEHSSPLDDEDLEVVPSGEIRFKRTVKNAFRQPRRDGDWEWNGEKHSSKYRIPLQNDDAEEVIPYPDILSRVSGEPVVPVSNTGYEAELFVQSQLEDEGWLVVNIRYAGYGYDILARKKGIIKRIEVKSSNGRVSPQFTENEFFAADRFRTSYQLFLVDNWNGKSGEITIIDDPVGSLDYSEVKYINYRFKRIV